SNLGAKVDSAELVVKFPHALLAYQGFSVESQAGDTCAVTTASPDRVRCTVTNLGDPQHPDSNPTSKTFELSFRARGHGPGAGEAEVRPTTPAGDDDPNDNKIPFNVVVKGADLALAPIGSP